MAIQKSSVKLLVASTPHSQIRPVEINVRPGTSSVALMTDETEQLILALSHRLAQIDHALAVSVIATAVDHLARLSNNQKDNSNANE